MLVHRFMALKYSISQRLRKKGKKKHFFSQNINKSSNIYCFRVSSNEKLQSSSLVRMCNCIETLFFSLSCRLIHIYMVMMENEIPRIHLRSNDANTFLWLSHPFIRYECQCISNFRAFFFAH